MPNPFSYRDKHVVLTGGSTGVGAALLEVLADLGAPRVTVLDVKPPAGGDYLPTDLGDRASVDAAVAAIDGPVDVLFNNAGVAATQSVTTVMSVNYLGPRRLSEALLDRIPTGGTIVNTASIAGNGWPAHLSEITELLALDDWDAALAWVEDHPQVRPDVYLFSKEVLQVHTMRSAKVTGARGVRTNAVCPGVIATPLMADFRATMTDAVVDWQAREANGRMAAPMEIAQVLAFLGSDASSYLNGTNLIADAGFTAAMTTGQVDFSGL